MNQKYIASDKEINGEGDKRNEQRENRHGSPTCTRCANLNAHSVRKLAQ
jgi:hypothetical protein